MLCLAVEVPVAELGIYCLQILLAVVSPWLVAHN